MTKNDETPRSVRDMPAPYAVCAGCGQTPALMDPLGDGEDLCPKCSAVHVLETAAAEHLRRLILPAVSAWAAHWQSSGLTRKQLLALVNETGGNLEADLTDWQSREDLNAEQGNA